MNNPTIRKTAVKFKLLHPDAKLPQRWSLDAVGWDIHAYLISETGRSNSLVLPPRTTRAVPTGLLIEPPSGHSVMVVSRSGMVLNQNIWVANAPGIIDPDYRGELVALLYNGSHETQWIRHEDRIAQIFIIPITPMSIMSVETLSESQRGAAGLGSTGT